VRREAGAGRGAHAVPLMTMRALQTFSAALLALEVAAALGGILFFSR
jgi:hypothetical protein